MGAEFEHWDETRTCPQCRGTLRAYHEADIRMLACMACEWTVLVWENTYGPGPTISLFDQVTRDRAEQATLDGAFEKCARCQGARWICEAHPSRPWPHDDCAGPGDPCPICNVAEPAEMPPDFRSLIESKGEHDE